MYESIEKFLSLAQLVIDNHNLVKEDTPYIKHQKRYYYHSEDVKMLSRQFAIVLNYGMNTFGLPKSQNNNTLDIDEYNEMVELFHSKDISKNYRDIPPTVLLQNLVIFFAKEVMANHRMPIDPRQMTLTSHGKEINVWKNFVLNYSYLVLKA